MKNTSFEFIDLTFKDLNYHEVKEIDRCVSIKVSIITENKANDRRFIKDIHDVISRLVQMGYKIKQYDTTSYLKQSAFLISKV